MTDCSTGFLMRFYLVNVLVSAFCTVYAFYLRIPVLLSGRPSGNSDSFSLLYVLFVSVPDCLVVFTI